MAEKTNDKPVNVHEGHRERLREKFLADPEMKAFREHEMIEYLLSLVIPRKDTNVIAHELMDKFGSLHGIFTSNPAELKEVRNMTTSAAYMLSSIYPVMRRSLRTREVFDQVPTLSTPPECAEYMHPMFIGRKTECMLVVYLNARNKVLYQEWIEGSYPDAIKLDKGAIVKRAVKEGASYLLFGHNHPSGNLAPSNEDIVETTKLYGALMTMSIRLYDSLIFNDDSYFSFRNNGIMETCFVSWNKSMEDSKNLQSPQHFNLNHRTIVRECVLNYRRLRDQGEMEAIDKDEHPPLTKEDYKLKNRSKPNF